jgi:hypothetical protein
VRSSPSERATTARYSRRAVGDDIQAVVRAKVEGADVRREPFPHLVVPDLLPEPFFRSLADAIPPVEGFEPSQRGIKADLPIRDGSPYFDAAPAAFRAVWSRLRDEVMHETVAPVLVRRLEAEIRDKYTDLLNADLADRILADGLVASDGRLMSRKAGYNLKPHTDSAHFAVTCLLYFTAGEDQTSGALCLFRPERTPELLDLSTYYPAKEEGIEAEVAATVPIRENLFVAFLNGRSSLHGVRIDEGKVSSESRLTYQAHILPRTDIRRDAETFIPDLPEAAGRRWQRWVDRMASRAQG